MKKLSTLHSELLHRFLHNPLAIFLGGADQLAEGKVLAIDLVNAEGFHLLYILDLAVFKQLEWHQVKGKDLIINVRHHKGAATTVQRGVDFVGALGREPGEEGAREAPLLQPGQQPAEKLALSAFRDDRHLLVVETQEGQFLAFATAQDTAADNADVILRKVVVEQYRQVRAIHGVEVAGALDSGPRQGGGLPELQDMLREEAPYPGHLLRMDEPDRITLVDGVDMMDVRTHVAGRVRTAEVVFFHIVRPLKQRIVGPFSHTKSIFSPRRKCSSLPRSSTLQSGASGLLSKQGTNTDLGRTSGLGITAKGRWRSEDHSPYCNISARMARPSEGSSNGT